MKSTRIAIRMRRFIALSVLTGVILAGCAGSASVDTYVTTYATEVKTLNYFLLLDTTALRVAANVVDGLVENDKYGRYVASLAEKWVHNEDFTEWTFTLRKGVKWIDHEGNPTEYEVTADDFVEGMRFIADPKNGIKNVSIIRKLIVGLNDYYWDLSDIDAGDDIGKTREEVLASFDSSIGVSASGTDTVTYTLTAPTPYFLSYLVTELFFPLEKAFIDKVGEDFGTAKEKILYCGAYYLSQWQRDKQITLTKNPHYWDADKIQVKSVVMQKVSDDAIRIQMFQRGEIASTSLSGEEVKALQGTDWEKYIYMSEKSTVNYWFFMNFTSSNPEFRAFVNDENFRKAMYYGIDRSKLIELLNPYDPSAMLRNTVCPEEVMFDSKGRDYTDYAGLKEIKNAGDNHNQAVAREFFMKAVANLVGADGIIQGAEASTIDMKPIAEFSVDGKLPLQLLYVHSVDSTDTKIALLFEAMIEDAFGKENVDVILGQYTDDKYNDVIEPRKFDMSYDSFSFKYADPMAQLGRLVTDGGVNDGQYSDPEFDALVDSADSETDISKRYEIFAKAEALFISRTYVIPWQAGGGAYTMSRIVPFTSPRGGFGVTRFKYKGMVVEASPITSDRYSELERLFYEELEGLSK